MYFSLDELGNIDLPAIIDYVLQVTKKSHLTYVGHSRGVAMAVILLSSQPEYNSKINLFAGIAPVIYSKEAKCIIYEFAGNRPNAIMRVSTLQVIIRFSFVLIILLLLLKLYDDSRKYFEKEKFVMCFRRQKQRD